MSVKIAVLVKQVPDHEASVKINSEQTLDVENRYVCSFFDEVAVQAAVDLKKENPDCELLALSAGGRRALDALRRAMAMGIDKVEHLGDEKLEQADGLTVAKVLAARLSHYKPDLVLSGKQALDDEMGAVGPMVARLLEIPYVGSALSITWDAKSSGLELTHANEEGIFTLHAKLPLLISAEKGLANPQVPIVTRVMKAMKHQIENISLSQLGIEPIETESRIKRLRYRLPAKRPAVTMLQEPFPENVSKLIHRLRQAGLVS